MVRITVFYLILVCLVLVGLPSCDFLLGSIFPAYLSQISLSADLSAYVYNSDNVEIYLRVLPAPNAVIGGYTDRIFLSIRNNENSASKIIILNDSLKVLKTLDNTSICNSLAMVDDYGDFVIGERRFDTSMADTTPAHPDVYENGFGFRMPATGTYCYTVANGYDVIYLNYNQFNGIVNANTSGTTAQIGPGTNYEVVGAAYLSNWSDINRVALCFRDQQTDRFYLCRVSEADFASGVLAAASPNIIQDAAYFSFSLGNVRSECPVHLTKSGVVVTTQDEKYALYNYNGNLVQDADMTNFSDFEEAYSSFLDNYYLYDRKTKTIYKCSIWW